jgi:dTDP-D-glucose 4,6-dehydratase
MNKENWKKDLVSQIALLHGQGATSRDWVFVSFIIDFIKELLRKEEIKWAEKLAQAEVRSYKAGREEARQQIKQKLKDLKGIDKETLKDIFSVLDNVD